MQRRNKCVAGRRIGYACACVGAHASRLYKCDGVGSGDRGSNGTLKNDSEIGKVTHFEERSLTSKCMKYGNVIIR